MIKPRGAATYIFSAFAVFLCAFFALAEYFNFNHLVKYLVAINLSALTLMFLDKSAALAAGKYRSPEKLLWLFALVGGTPGIYLGMHLFRHKTRKASFQLVLVTIAVLQLFVYWVYIKVSVHLVT